MPGDMPRPARLSYLTAMAIRPTAGAVAPGRYGAGSCDGERRGAGGIDRAGGICGDHASALGTFEVIQVAVFVGVIGAALVSAIWLIRERGRTSEENVLLRGKIAELNASLQRADAMLNLRDQRVIVWGSDHQQAGAGRLAAAGCRRARRSRRVPRLRPLADAAFGGLARPCADGAARKIGRLRPHGRSRPAARRSRCRAARLRSTSSSASCR